MRNKPGKVARARLTESIEYQSEVLGFYFVDKVKPLKVANNLIKMVIREAESGSTIKKELD